MPWFEGRLEGDGGSCSGGDGAHHVIEPLPGEGAIAFAPSDRDLSPDSHRGHGGPDVNLRSPAAAELLDKRGSKTAHAAGDGIHPSKKRPGPIDEPLQNRHLVEPNVPGNLAECLPFFALNRNARPCRPNAGVSGIEILPKRACGQAPDGSILSGGQGVV